MPILLRHNDTVFEDRTVYATGNAYLKCNFRRCTVVFKGLPFLFDTCIFSGCIWHIDVLLHDREQTTELMQFVSDLVTKSLPTLKESEPDSDPD